MTVSRPFSPSAASDSAAILRPPAPVWWSLQRTPAAIRRFRFVAGLGLIAHFTEHLINTAPLLVRFGVYDPQLLEPGLTLRHSWLGAGMSPMQLHLFFGGALLLSASLTAGFAPRAAAAALLIASVITYWAILPAANINDYLASLTTLFLALMPIGDEPSPSRRQIGPRTQSVATVPGLAVTLFLSHVVVVYLSSGFGAFASYPADRFAQNVARLIPLAFVIPIPGLRVLGVALQLAASGYWLGKTGLIFATVVLAASSLLFWGEPEPDASPRRVLDFGAVMGILCTVTAIVAGGALLLGLRRTPALRMLADVGLSPLGMEWQPEPEGSLFMVVKDTGRRIPAYRGSSLRERRLIAHFDRSRGADPTRASIASSIARRQCWERGSSGQVHSLVWSDASGDLPITEFECGIGGSVLFQ